MPPQARGVRFTPPVMHLAPQMAPRRVQLAPTHVTGTSAPTAAPIHQNLQSFPTAHPFHEALHQAAQNVAHAQRAVPNPSGFGNPVEGGRTAAQWDERERALRHAGYSPATVRAQLSHERSQGLGRELPRIEAQEHGGGGGPSLFGVIPAAPILHAIATASQFRLPVIGKTLPGRFASELIDLPAQTILSGALTGNAAVQAAQGNTGEAKEIGGGMLHQIEHPLQSAKEAPLATALVLGGLAGGASRIAGSAGRAVAPEGSALARALSTERPALNLTGGLKVERNFDKGPLQKGAQILGERVQRRRGRISGPAHAPQAEGKLLQKQMAGGWVKPGKTDQFRAGTGSMEARARTHAVTEALNGESRRHLTPTGHHGEEGHLSQAGIYEGGFLPGRVHEEAAKYLKDLEDAEKGLHTITGPKRLVANPKPLEGPALDANRASQEHMREILRHPEPSQAVFRQTRELVRGARPGEAARIAMNEIGAPEAERAPLFKYAIRQMGARPYTAKDAADARLVAKARIAEARRNLQAVNEQRSALQRRVGTEEHGRLGERLSRTTQSVHAAEQRVRDAEMLLERTPRGASLRHADGTTLTNAEIYSHMRDEGIPFENGRPLIGYVSHELPAEKAGLVRGGRQRPPMPKGPRTGVAVLNGTYEHGYEAVARALGRNAERLVRHQIANRYAQRFGQIKGTTSQAADEFLRSEAGHRLAERLGGLVKHQIGQKPIVESGAVEIPANIYGTLDRMGLPHEPPQAIGEPGQWTVVPKSVPERLGEHASARGATKGGRLAEEAVRMWRQARLYTSTRHLFGVPLEQGIRDFAENVAPGLTIAGKNIGGRSFRLGRRFRTASEAVADEHGPNQGLYRELLGLQGGRGFIYSGSQALDEINRGNNFERSASQYVMKGKAGGQSSRAVQDLLKPWEVWHGGVQKAMAAVERSTRDPIMGKYVKEHFGSWRQANQALDEGIHELVRTGRLSESSIEKISTHLNDSYGNWEQYTPFMRQLASKVAPFAPWWVNAMRFLIRMPMAHPLKTALAASLYYGTRRLRAMEGQGYEAKKPEPEYQQGSIPGGALAGLLGLPTGTRFNPAYYSSQLAPQPLTAADMILPGAAGIWQVAHNRNPISGKELLSSTGKELTPDQTYLNVASELAEAPTPFGPQVQQLLQGGGKPYGTANLLSDIAERAGLAGRQVKPGTQHSLGLELEKLFLPERFTFGKGGGNISPQKLEALQRKAEEQIERPQSEQKAERLQQRAEEIAERQSERVP
jgi:hypothetical protein